MALLKDAGAPRRISSLARQQRPEKDRAADARAGRDESWEGVDRDLFERLRALRLEIARARGVPPYVIFHDTTLREMARSKPTTIDALRHVYGVGAARRRTSASLVLGRRGRKPAGLRVAVDAATPTFRGDSPSEAM